MEKVNLISRYKEVETIATLIEDNKAIVESNGQYIRYILDPKDSKHIESIDFDGGPMISEGTKIFTKKIKKIKNCIMLELE